MKSVLLPIMLMCIVHVCRRVRGSVQIYCITDAKWADEVGILPVCLSFHLVFVRVKCACLLTTIPCTCTCMCICMTLWSGCNAFLTYGGCMMISVVKWHE